MYIKITDNGPVPYSIGQLIQDNPGTSFPVGFPEAMLASYGVYPLVATEQPAYDPMTQDLAEGVATQQDGQWVQTWVVTQASAEEVAQRQAERAAQIQAQRAEAYRTESDPLFFKAQRGEATQQQWLDKVAEIKARYPA